MMKKFRLSFLFLLLVGVFTDTLQAVETKNNQESKEFRNSFLDSMAENNKIRQASEFDENNKTLTIPAINVDVPFGFENGFHPFVNYIEEGKLKLNKSGRFEILGYSEKKELPLSLSGTVVRANATYYFDTRELRIERIRINGNNFYDAILQLKDFGEFEIISFSDKKPIAIECTEEHVTREKYNQIVAGMYIIDINRLMGCNAQFDRSSYIYGRYYSGEPPLKFVPSSENLVVISTDITGVIDSKLIMQSYGATSDMEYFR